MDVQKQRGYDAKPQDMQQLGAGKGDYPARRGTQHPHTSDLQQNQGSKSPGQMGGKKPESADLSADPQPQKAPGMRYSDFADM